MPAVAVTQPVIDSKLITPFVNSVRRLVKTMLGVEAITEKLSIRDTPASQYDYSGIIGFSGTVVGTIVVSLHAKDAVSLVLGYSGCEFEEGSADFTDAIGELANMIAGSAKNDLGGGVYMSTPSVVAGKGHVISRPQGVPCLVLPCKTTKGNFVVEISIKSVG